MSFRVGQKVVYVQGSVPKLGLIKNQIYTIYGMLDCNCPKNHLDVGVPSDKTFIYCEDCGAIISLDDRWFLHQDGFRPVVEDSIEEMVSEIKQIDLDNLFK